MGGWGGVGGGPCDYCVSPVQRIGFSGFFWLGSGFGACWDRGLGTWTRAWQLQGVPEKTLFIVQKLITLVWNHLLGQVAVPKSSVSQLSYEHKKSRKKENCIWKCTGCPGLFTYMHLWENCVWKASYKALNTKERFFWDTLYNWQTRRQINPTLMATLLSQNTGWNFENKFN